MYLQQKEVPFFTMKDSFTDSWQSFKEEKDKRRTVLAFAAIGFLADIFFYTNLSSSQDILQGTVIATSFVFLSSTGPACVATMIYPFLFQKIETLVGRYDTPSVEITSTFPGNVYRQF